MSSLESTAAAGQPSLYRRFEPALVALSLTSFVAATYGFGMYLFAAILPNIRESLGFSYATAGVITGAAQGAFMLFAIGGAVLAHRIGGAWVALLSMAVCSLGLLLVPFAPNIFLIGVLLVILGGCAASVYVPMVDLASRTVPKAHRGKVLGLISSGTSYGVFVNGLLAPSFLAKGDWQGIWTAVGAISVVFTLIGFLVLYRAGVLSRTGRAKPVPATAARPAAQAKSSLFQTLKSAEGWVLMIVLITFLNGLTTMPFQNFLTSYLQNELGYEVAFSGTIWIMIGLIGMVSGFALGTLADRIGIRSTMVLTYILLLVAALLLALVPVKAMVIVAGICFSLAFYPIFGLVPAYIAKTPSRLSPTSVFAIANVTLGVGGIVGNLLGGYWVNLVGGFVGIYIAVAVLTVGLSFLAWMLPAEVRGNE